MFCNVSIIKLKKFCHPSAKTTANKMTFFHLFKEFHDISSQKTFIRSVCSILKYSSVNVARRFIAHAA